MSSDKFQQKLIFWKKSTFNPTRVSLSSTHLIDIFFITFNGEVFDTFWILLVQMHFVRKTFSKRRNGTLCSTKFPQDQPFLYSIFFQILTEYLSHLLRRSSPLAKLRLAHHHLLLRSRFVSKYVTRWLNEINYSIFYWTSI